MQRNTAYAGARSVLGPAAMRRDERWQSLAFAMVWIMTMSIPWGDMILLPFEVQASRVFSVTTAVVWLILLWRSRKAKPLRSAHWLLLLFVAWAAINVLWTTEAERGLRRATSYLQLFFVAWVIHQCCDSATHYLRLLQAYICGCLVGVAGLLWNFGREVYTGDGRYTAPGFDPNDLAVTLALAIPMAWHLELKGSGVRWLNRLFVPAAVICILLTASRSGLVTLGICLTFVLATLARFSRRSFLRLALVGGLTSVLVTYMWSEVSIHRLSTIFEQLSTRDMNGRVDIWQRGYSAFLESPLVGHGAGGFGAAVGTRRSRELAAHNAYLGILVEHGLIGLVLFVGAFCAVFARAMKSYASEPRLWAVLLLAWAVAVMSLSWENRETTWLLFGLGAALQRKPRAVRWLIPMTRPRYGNVYA